MLGTLAVGVRFGADRIDLGVPRLSDQATRVLVPRLLASLGLAVPAPRLPLDELMVDPRRRQP